MSTPLTVECDVPFRTAAKRRKKMAPGAERAAPAMPERVPRIARLMALAIRFEGPIRDGVVASEAELARLGRVSRARVSQIMNLLQLAPDIQEKVLFMAAPDSGRE